MNTPQASKTGKSPRSSKGRVAPASGAQTLARGLEALQIIVDSEVGMSAQEVAEELGVHRTVAHRMLVTLAAAGFVTKDSNAKYCGSVGLMGLVPAVYGALTQKADPIVSELAEQLGATATLLVAEGDQAVALLGRTPSNSMFHMHFEEGDTHSLELAAGGKALRSIMGEHAGDESLDQVREDGYSITHGEVEVGAWGVAVPLEGPRGIPLCINVITHREDVARNAVEPVKEAVRRLSEKISEDL